MTALRITDVQPAGKSECAGRLGARRGAKVGDRYGA